MHNLLCRAGSPHALRAVHSFALLGNIPVLTVQQFHLCKAVHIHSGALSADVLPDCELLGAPGCQEIRDLLVIQLQIGRLQLVLLPPLQDMQRRTATIYSFEDLNWDAVLLHPLPWIHPIPHSTHHEGCRNIILVHSVRSENAYLLQVFGRSNALEQPLNDAHGQAHLQHQHMSSASRPLLHALRSEQARKLCGGRRAACRSALPQCLLHGSAYEALEQR